MQSTIQTISYAEFEKLLTQYGTEITYTQTPAGVLKIFLVDGFVYKTAFMSEQEMKSVKSYVIQKKFTPKKILLVGTPFQCSVWRAAYTIPTGKKVSYTDIACMIGSPTSVRAVANALGDNNIAYFIPCHRVLRKTGDLCGYNWGVERKEALLKSEGAL